MRRLTRAALSPAHRWFVATLWLAATAAGQAPDPPLPDVFGEFLDVRVVNIEVVVTDGAGRRVSGLGVGDFVLTVDGREVPIEYFSEVAAGAARESTGVEPLPGVAPGEHVGTSFLVYVDDNHTRKVDRDPIVLGLIDQLSALGESDRMAVVVQHGTRLQLLSGWSSSQSELRTALRQLLDGERYGGSAQSSLVVARTLGLRPGDRGLADVTDDGPAGASSSPLPFEAEDDSLVERSFLEVLGGAPMRLVPIASDCQAVQLCSYRPSLTRTSPLRSDTSTSSSLRLASSEIRRPVPSKVWITAISLYSCCCYATAHHYHPPDPCACLPDLFGSPCGRHEARQAVH